MALGAIVKSAAGSLAKQQGKKIVADKLMGRKPKALPAAGQTGASKKDTAMNMVSSMASKSSMQGPEIPASKQTINVSAETVGSDIGSGGGGSAIVKQVQDISVVVATIADSMKGNLVLKEKAQSKARKAAERDKRAAQEAATEKPKKPQKEDDGGQKFNIPKIGFLSGIFGFITKFIFGIAIMKLIEIANSPIVKGIIGALKFAGNLITKFLFPIAGGFLDGLATFVDLAYTITDGAEKIVKNIFGEEGAEKFRTFMENFKTLINSFVIFKILKAKFGEAIAKNIKNVFKFIKNFARRALANIGRFLGPGARKSIKGVFKAGKGLLGKGVAKVGGFASKIFGKAAKFVSPALKGALPAVKGFAKRIPILGPLIVGVVSLMSGEPAAQALFKAMGAALGGALGTFIPIPVIGTLIGETIGVFVGDLLYELILGGGAEAAGQKLKDTFKTFVKPIFDFFKDGFGRFIEKFKEENKTKFGVTNWLALLNLTKTVPLLAKSFFPKIFGGDESEKEINKEEVKKEKLKVSEEQDNKNGKNAEEVSSETTYESGEGDAMIIPIPVPQSGGGQTIVGKTGKGTGAIKKIFIDDTELSLYGGK